jgi:hypothetical protein
MRSTGVKLHPASATASPSTTPTSMVPLTTVSRSPAAGS